jgi:hypothetical protein
MLRARAWRNSPSGIAKTQVDADRFHDESGDVAFAQHLLHLDGGLAIDRR